MWIALSAIALGISTPTIGTSPLPNEPLAQPIMLSELPFTLPDLPPLDLAPIDELTPTPEPLPSPEDLLNLPIDSGVAPPDLDVSGTIVVQSFQVMGSTVFSAEDFAKVTADYLNRPITFAELLAARTAVTQLYIDAGYITTGAYIPADQDITNGIVEIRVVEGYIEAIEVEGLQHLQPGYVRSRIAQAGGAPLNIEQLIEGLQLLQLDPLIDTLSADLAAGTRLGGSIVNLSLQEAQARSLQIGLDNGRSPTIGSFRRRVQFTDRNLLGIGDSFDVSYSNTDGSNGVTLGYAVPINSNNGTVSLRWGRTRSRVIDPNFAILNIESFSEDFQLGFRQPILRSPTQELALGLQLTQSVSSSTFQLPGVERLEFPLVGAPDGTVQINALRLTQEWTQRNASQVFAVRSTFNVGLEALGATVNAGDIPDSNFFSWQGQAQWAQLIAPSTLLLVRLDGQLADRPLLSGEQFRLGGQGSVRGYRQDRVIADNGILASLELRFPLLQLPQLGSTVQLAPFVDYGYGWNSGGQANATVNELASVGAGLLWQMGDRFSARLEYGFPLINGTSEGRTWQENGLIFSITTDLF
jgi:hemolysin activation/secretion protein